MDDTNCIISQFDPEEDLGLTGQNDGLNYNEVDVVSNEMEEQTISVTDDEDLIFQLMDIRVPLLHLKSMLEQRTGQNLINCEFWLQNTKMLECHKTLVDQCIKGTGLVQVNIKLATEINRIVIVDVLKPDEDLLEAGKQNILYFDEVVDNDQNLANVSTAIDEEYEDQNYIAQKKENPNKTPMKWVVDEQFLRDQRRLNIPEDPNFWTVSHVRHWIQWAVRHFNLIGVKLTDWLISGSELCNLSQPDFKKKVPKDPRDLFWTHIELLRRCKFIAVVQKEEEIPDINNDQHDDVNSSPSAIKKKPKLTGAGTSDGKSISPIAGTASSVGQRIGNNGQVQLWQFLLELLTSSEHTHVIQWIGADGEFRLIDPELVAQLWGIRKHKPTMNYEKLSRALRYYYDGDMIAKVTGKRFVYRFVCNLKDLIGYDAAELKELVKKASNDDGYYEM